MTPKEVLISVRRSGTLAFDVCIRTGNIDTRTDLQQSLDGLFEKSTAFRLFDWAVSISEDPHSGQSFQKEFVHLAIRTFCGEAKEAFKLLNTWVNAVEKKVGKNNLVIEFERS